MQSNQIERTSLGHKKKKKNMKTDIFKNKFRGKNSNEFHIFPTTLVSSWDRHIYWASIKWNNFKNRWTGILKSYL